MKVICFFQESHSVSADVNFWKSQWGNDVWYSHGTERSAGVTTLKGSFGGIVLHSDCDSLGHYICLVVEYNHFIFTIVNLYGYNTKPENDKLIDSLDTRISFSNLIIGGDFNVSLNDTIDRWPPAQHFRKNLRLETFMDKFNVTDIWRDKFPDDISFTWSNRSGSRESRIDFWLISSSLSKDSVTVNILTTSLTDHRAIYINLQLFPTIAINRSSYWKLNSSLLSHTIVKSEITRLLKHFIHKANIENSYGINWEILKFERSKMLRQYGAKIAKSRAAAEEENLIVQSSAIYQLPPDEVSEEDRLHLRSFQSKLDELYRQKAEGAFVRSRKR